MLDTARGSCQHHEMHDVRIQRFRERGKRWRVSLLVLPVLGSGCLLLAQSGTSGPTAWEGVFTEAQASRGTAAFGQSCSNCHVLATEGKIPLVGDLFWKSFSQKSVAELFDYVSSAMPNGAPGSLSKDAYADIVAAMLKSNGFPAGNRELLHAALPEAQIIPKDGRMELPANALVRVVGCLTRNGPDWVVSRATTPERAERTRTAEDDAARVLGTRNMTLKFLVTKLDAMAGARVVVTGLLIGTDGVDGINVTTVNRIAPQCR